jgi:nucleotide-binding universal stress UspA family protein
MYADQQRWQRRKATMRQSRGRVIVGVSESLAGLQALRFAVTAATTRECDLVAVRSWNYSSAAATEFDVTSLQRILSVDADGVVANAFAMALGGPPADVTVHVAAPQGKPGRAIISQVIGAEDLIVIGCPRRNWFDPRGARVARYCVRHAVCPVLIVPVAHTAIAVRISARRICRDAEALVRNHDG